MSLELVSTATIAEELSVSRDWVRDHAAELGAIRIGDGPRGELRFDPERVARELERRRVGREQARERRCAAARRVTPDGVVLLPLPGEDR